MEFITIIGGVFLILFGLRYVRKGFARILGGDLLDWLQRYTRTRTRAFLGGVIAGTVMPSSTAMAFLSVQMTREGKISWANVLAVLLGAHVGITVLIQVLALNLREYAPLFLAVGGFLFLFLKAQRLRGIGQATLAFGFLLLAMGLISGAARTIATDPAISNLFEALAALPWLLVFGAVVLTMLIQSSTASIAVALGLAATGQVTLTMLLLWVLGANIGLCLTVLVAGWSRLEGRRLGISLLLVKIPLAVACIAVLLSLPEGMLAQLPGSLNQQAAWAHTLFNLLGVIGAFNADRLGRIAMVFAPDPTEPAESPSRLDPILQQHPSLAVNAALRETLRLFDTLHILRESVFDGLRARSLPPAQTAAVHRRAAGVLAVRDEVVSFLDGVSDEDLDKNSRVMKDTLDDLMREMPVIVRTFERDLLEEAQELIAKSPGAIEKALPLLEEAARRCAQQIESIARMLMQQNRDLARDILARKQENSAWMISVKRQHTTLPDPAWEIIDDFQQLNRRLTGVVYVFCGDSPLAENL